MTQQMPELNEKILGKDLSFSLPRRLIFDKKNFNAHVVERGEGDLVYQFVSVRHKDFKNLISEVVESYFGTTAPFRLDHVPEIDTWGLLAKGVRTSPLYNESYFTTEFLALLDSVMDEAK